MNREVRQCQNCSQQFAIDPEDFDFYRKIGVPAPTFCPECRAKRRMTWRNERTLYRRKCAFSGKEVISCFSPDSGIEVYNRDDWWSDKWDPLSYGRDYDFNTPFFKQFRDLLKRVPMPAVFNSKVVNTEYGNHAGNQKNGYLVFACWEGEDLSYASKTMSSKDSVDILGGGHIEFGYEIINSEKIYKSAFLQNCENCSDSYFLYECKGCANCFGCVNLRNKSYYFLNEACTKEDYQAKVKGLRLDTYSGLLAAKEKFSELKRRSLRKYANIINGRNCTGDNLFNADNCRESYDVHDFRDCKFINNGGAALADSYDGYGVGAQAELIYESIDTGDKGQRMFFDIFVWGGNSVWYSYASHGCTDLFGCIGLRQKQYCILNKQYTKEEYEELMPKIIEHMKSNPYIDKRAGKSLKYEFGEFFPSDLSPFVYNETIAQENFPLTKEMCEKEGYRWRDKNDKDSITTKKAGGLPDSIYDAGENILNEVIECRHKSPEVGGCDDQCTAGFRITPNELQFYKRFGLPLPRLCSNCRHYERMRLRNPFKLWERRCMCGTTDGQSPIVYRNTAEHFHGKEPCPNTFKTTFAPERPEAVYCEECYNAELEI